MSVTANTSDAKAVLERHKELQRSTEPPASRMGLGRASGSSSSGSLRVADSARQAAYERTATQATPEAQATVDEAESERTG